MLREKAALVLSGGGSLGAAHLGVLRVLEKKYEFDFLAGVSAGAIVVAALAVGKTAGEISALLGAQSFFRLAFDFSKSKWGILRGEKVLALLREVLGDITFADLPAGKTLIIGATDFSSGERVLLREGSVAAAVRASLSVPALFEPCHHEGRWLVDGGLSQNFPLDVAIGEYQGKTIFGIDVCSISPDAPPITAENGWKFPAIWRGMERSIRILFRNQQNFPSDPRVTLIRPELGTFSGFDIGKLQEIEERGERAAEKIFSN